jgi:hypothetical protein
MPHPFRYLSLATATLLFSLTPLLPVPSSFSLVVQAQTTQGRRAEALRLNKEGLQLFNRSQFREALAKFQQALVIVKELGERKGEGSILNNIGNVYLSLALFCHSPISPINKKF